MITGKERSARVLFDEVAATYESTAQGRVFTTSSLTFRRREQEVVALVDRVAGAEAALEFGMGPAVYLEPCLERGMSYHGIDFAPEMVDRARSRERPGTSFEVGDQGVLERHAGRYDLVLAIGLID